MDSLVAASILQVVIHPTKQDLLRRKLEQVLQGLSWFEETHKVGVVLQVDGCHQSNLQLLTCQSLCATHSNDLPDQPEDEVNLTLHQILCTNVDNVAADGLGRVDTQVLILCDLEGVEVGALVDGSLVNCALDGRVNEFAASLRMHRKMHLYQRRMPS